MAKTGERLVPELYRSGPEYLLYLRHLFAYELAIEFIGNDDAVLDLASGSGYGTQVLARHAGNVTGVDIDTDAVTSARETYGSERCQFVSYEGTRLPFHDSSFDVVTSFQTVEHVDDDRNFVTEVRRVLRQGGTLVLSTPNRVTRIPAGRRPWNRFHVREYTAAELRALLGTVFANVNIKGVRASSAIEAIERARVRKANRIARLDPLNLRRLIPTSLVTRFTVRHGRTADDGAPHTTSDFFVTADDVEDAMDLLAICS